MVITYAVSYEYAVWNLVDAGFNIDALRFFQNGKH
jgi:hypothetical protein